MHTAEVLALALESRRKPIPAPAKRRNIETGRTQPEASLSLPILLVGFGLLAGAAYLLVRRTN